MARPRRPSYISVRKVLNAIRSCSCGKASDPKLPPLQQIKLSFSCECIGPKSWSKLIRLTELHHDTLSKTCKFLVKKGVLTKRKVGREVLYRMNNEYRYNDEMEYSVKERKRRQRHLTNIMKAASLSVLDEEFSRIHRDEILAVREGWPELENMQLTWYGCLLHLMHILGVREGLTLFFEMYTKLRQSDFNAFAIAQAYGQSEYRLRMRRFNRLYAPSMRAKIRLFRKA